MHRILSLGAELVPAGPALHARLQNLEIERSRLTASRFGRTEGDPQVEVLDSLIEGHIDFALDDRPLTTFESALRLTSGEVAPGDVAPGDVSSGDAVSGDAVVRAGPGRPER